MQIMWFVNDGMKESCCVFEEYMDGKIDCFDHDDDWDAKGE